jgi:anti-sigma B factor antagonist
MMDCGPGFEPFSVEIRSIGDGVRLLTIGGELDLATSPRLQAALAALPAWEAGRLVVDMARVSFVDPSGARALLTAAREHGSLTVSSVSPEAARTFALLGLDDVLTAAVTKSASARS